MTEGSSPRPLKLDRPRIVEADGPNTVVARHFEDGSSRVTIYDQNGGALLVTRRTNPSTGAAETTKEFPDGSSERVVEHNDGTSVTVATSATGAVTRTERTFTPEGKHARTTTFPDGSVETEVRIEDAEGIRNVLRRADGTELVVRHSQSTRENGDVVITEVREESTGQVSSTETIRHPDGSSDVTVRDQGQVVETRNIMKLPDGATRERVSRPDGSVETTLTREYTNADNARIKEVLGENQVQITTTRPDGSTSDVVKFDDGTFESTDVTRMANGSTVFTRTNRDRSFETVEHLATAPGDVPRTVTTRSDGTRVEQFLDAERMHTTVHRPDGTRSEIRRDMDGVGSTAEFDANGGLTSVTTHDGEPLEPFPGFVPGPDLGGPTAGGPDDPVPDVLLAELDDRLPGGAGGFGPDEVLADALAPGAGGDGSPVQAPEASAEVDPVFGDQPFEGSGRGVRLDPGVVSGVEAEVSTAGVGAGDGTAPHGGAAGGKPLGAPPFQEDAVGRSVALERESLAEPEPAPAFDDSGTTFEPEPVTRVEASPEPGAGE